MATDLGLTRAGLAGAGRPVGAGRGRAGLRHPGGARHPVLPADRRVVRCRIDRAVMAASATRRRVHRRRHRAARRRTGQDRGPAGVRRRRRSQPVRPGPGQGAAFRVVPPAGRQDPGGRARRGRGAADQADPFAGGRPDRQGDRRATRLRRRPGRPGRAGARHRPPAVRAQRRVGAGPGRRRGGRVRGQRAEPAAAQPARTQDHHRGRPAGRAEPDQGVAGRGDQVPVAAAARRAASSASTPTTPRSSTGSGRPVPAAPGAASRRR